MRIRLYSLIYFIKSVCFIFLIGSVALLSGCTRFMHHFSYEYIQEPVPSQCFKADLLITNLNVKPAQQHYQLLNGTTCTGVNYASE